MAVEKETHIYVPGSLYEQSAFPDDPSIVLFAVDEKMREISNFKYEEIYVNRSENRFSNGTTREQLLVFMKKCSLENNSFIDGSQMTTLRTIIIEKLNTVQHFNFSDVEIRSVARQE